MIKIGSITSEVECDAVYSGANMVYPNFINDCLIWYDPNHASKVTLASGLVSSVTNKGSLSNNATQGTSTLSPALSTINGKNVFDFTDDKLEMQSEINMIDKVITFIIRPRVVNSIDQIFSHTTNNYQLRVRNSRIEVTALVNPYLNDGGGAITFNTPINPNTNYVVTIHYGNPIEMWVNGVKDSVTDARETSSPMNYNSIGERVNRGEYYDGLLGDFIIYTDVANRVYAERYINRKYGL